MDASTTCKWILGCEQTGPPTLYCDNQGAIKLVHTPEFHRRTKHIDEKYYFIRQQFQERSLNVDYVNTKFQLGDLLTKPLVGSIFQEMRSKIQVLPCSV